jgi:hypothetical protein
MAVARAYVDKRWYHTLSFPEGLGRQLREGVSTRHWVFCAESASHGRFRSGSTNTGQSYAGLARS